MNITNVTVTKVAEESTENADYQLEYSIVNDALTRVHASIRKKDTDGSGLSLIHILQQRVLSRILTGFPFHPWRRTARNHFQLQKYKYFL